MDEGIEKGLADATLRKKKYTRKYYSSGIRELDEMLGGGFMPGTFTLFQQDIGAGGDIIFSKIIELQQTLSNIVLVILADPTSTFLEKELEENQSDNLLVLNLVQQSKKNINIMFDKHELSLKIRDARNRAKQKLDLIRVEEKDDDIQLFVLFVTLNPFVLNLAKENVIRILYDNLLQCSDHKSIDLILLTKNIISEETNARIQSLCHGVIELRSYFEGVQKKNEIRILKMIGHYYDAKIEPYLVAFDDKKGKFSFNIKSAFLTSFETFRNLLSWNHGTISLSKQPYIVTPISYVNSLLEMPYNIDKVKGVEEVLEKAQGIGRRLTIMVENLYFVEGIDLLKATMQTASLLGWGDATLKAFEPEENLLTLIHYVHKNFNQEIYKIFLEGYYRGQIKRSLKRGIRYLKINPEDDRESNKSDPQIIPYRIRIRLSKPQDE